MDRSLDEIIAERPVSLPDRANSNLTISYCRHSSDSWLTDM